MLLLLQYLDGTHRRGCNEVLALSVPFYDRRSLHAASMSLFAAFGFVFLVAYFLDTVA